MNQHNYKIHGAKSERTERRSRQIHIYSGRLQHLISITDKELYLKISKDIEVLNTTINKHNPVDTYRASLTQYQQNTYSFQAFMEHKLNRPSPQS